MKVSFCTNPYDFFKTDGYPYNLDCVERRDGYDKQLSLIKKYFSLEGANVLDAGCGNGRLSGPLSGIGANVYSVDLVIDVIIIAKSRYPSVNFIASDIRQLPFKDHTFDYVISAYSSLGYIPSYLQAELLELRRVTKKHGWILIDLLNGDKKIRGLGCEKIPGGLGIYCRNDIGGSLLQWNLSLSYKNIGLYRLCYPYRSLFSIQGILTRAGWKVVDVFGDYNFEPFSKKSNRMILICKAA